MEASDWTFLSNHAHVLLCISRDPDTRLRDIAANVGITERAVQRIVMELVEAGVLERERHGRRNHYRLHGGVPLRHPLESHRTVGDLVKLLKPLKSQASSARKADRESA
ncbi:MAG: winged helix-turn-helix domain-containing protein [Myxococcota bacterium]